MGVEAHRNCQMCGMANLLPAVRQMIEYMPYELFQNVLKNWVECRHKKKDTASHVVFCFKVVPRFMNSTNNTPLASKHTVAMKFLPEISDQDCLFVREICVAHNTDWSFIWVFMPKIRFYHKLGPCLALVLGLHDNGWERLLQRPFVDFYTIQTEF